MRGEEAQTQAFVDDASGVWIEDPFLSVCGRLEVTDPDKEWGAEWRETFPELAAEFDRRKGSE